MIMQKVRWRDTGRIQLLKKPLITHKKQLQIFNKTIHKIQSNDHVWTIERSWRRGNTKIKMERKDTKKKAYNL